jgi:2-keto-4-pentenoate hydratase
MSISNELMVEKRATSVERAAAALYAARSSGKPCAPVRNELPEMDVAAAYAVQDIGTNRMLADGRRLVGRKIGLTSPLVQSQLGIDQPDYGMLFDDMDVPLGTVIPWNRVLQPKVEAEMAFIMGSALNDERLTSADVIASIEYVVAAIEIVCSRIAGWDIRLIDTIADNASSGLFVIGHEIRKLNQFDIVAATMTMTRANEVVSTGSGAACMGSPVSALLWLARTMARLGRPLDRGDIVLSGALGPMSTVSPGDVYEARIENLGTVKIAFSEDKHHEQK